MKILLPYLKKFYGQIIFVFLILPIGSISFSAQPIIMQRAVDGPLLKADLNGLWVYALALAAAIFINFIIQILQFWIFNTMGQNLVADLRDDLFAHLQKLSMSFFDRTPVGRSVSRLTSDMEQLAESLASGLIMILLEIFNILGILLFMFYLNWQLSLAILVFLVPIYFISIYYQRIFRDANLKARQELSKLNSFLQQNIVGISVVHLLNSTEKNMKKFAEDNRRYFKANDQSIKADSQLSATIELVSFIAIAALLYLSMKILGGPFSTVISIGVILAFLQYTQSLFEPIRNLSERFTVIQSAFTAMERVKQLVDEPITIKDHDGQDLSYESSGPIIEFDKVSFRYSEDTPWILKDLSFKIQKGQKVAFTGRTGSGKSTIIKLLTRLYEPQSGTIKVNGVDIKNIKQSELRKMIAVIHQDSYIFAGNLEENISLGREDLNMSFAEPFMETISLDMDTELSERAANISAGEEQVINFARAVVSNPEILVLDEATAKIDLKTEAQIQKALKEFLKDKTAILIAHRLETIKGSDQIIELS